MFKHKFWLLTIILFTVTSNKIIAMSFEGKNICDKLTQKEVSNIVPVLRNADWEFLRNDELFISKIFDIMQSASYSKSKKKLKSNIQIKGWASYIIGRLNSKKPLECEQFDLLVKCLEVKETCLNMIPVEKNHVNVTIYQYGDYPNIEHMYNSNELGLAYCISEDGKPSFPVFKHTVISESFEFLAGSGYVALSRCDETKNVKIITTETFNSLSMTNGWEKTTLYLIPVCQTKKLLIPAGTNVQFCSFVGEPLKFLIYSYPPFSHVEEGSIQSTIEEKESGFWSRETNPTNKNSFYKIAAFLKLMNFDKALEILETVTFAELEEFLKVINYDYETINDLFAFFTKSIPTIESMHSMAKLKGQWWDFIAAFFGLEESHEVTRYKRSKEIFDLFLELESLSLKKEIIQSFIKLLPFHTFHSSAAQRVSPLALVVINMINGEKNLFDTSILEKLPTSELAQSLKNHLYFGIPELWKDSFSISNFKFLPKSFLPNDNPKVKKQYRWLDVATAPKGTGSTALNFLKRVFGSMLPDIKFSFFGTDIMFPQFSYDKEFHCFKRVFTDIDKVGIDTLNDITFYDGRMAKFDVADSEFDKDNQLGTYDFISVVKAFHHFHKYGSVKKLMPLASEINSPSGKKSVEWYNEKLEKIKAPLYYMDESQQRAAQNLLSKLSVNGFLFLELCFLHLPDYRLINSDNEDSFVIIKRISDEKFVIYSQVIPFNPQPFESYPYEEFLLYGDDIGKNSRYYYRIGMNFPGFIKAYGLDNLIESDLNNLKQLLKEAHLLVYRYQKRDHNPWCQMRDAAQAVREGKTVGAAMQTYMSYVPESDDKKRILENIETIIQREHKS